jgi:ornithine carbamoyltransferase
VRVCGPAEYQPDPAVLARAATIAAGTGGAVSAGTDPKAAADRADVLVTDTWVSMGQSDEAQRAAELAPYGIDGQLLALGATDAIVLHCLPAYRGKEISAEVIDGPQSVVFDEAENRLHAQKALLTWLIEHS